MLLIKEVDVLAKYLDLVDVFSKELAVELLKRSNINEHLINLDPDKQPPYRLIYSLSLLKLKTFKTYIKTN